jgi:hypothetical protein
MKYRWYFAVCIIAVGVALAMPEKPISVRVGWGLVVYGASLLSSALAVAK